MKTKLFTLFLALIVSTGILFASTQIGDVYYNLDNTNKTAEVTYIGSSNNYNTTLKYTGSIVIPSSISYGSTYSVTSIGEHAFSHCSGLTSVTIPNSVTSIGIQAFYGCSGLTDITIPNGVTSIGTGAFSNCSGLTSVTISKSVTSIGGLAFYGCSSLTSIVIMNGNTKYDSRDNCNAIIETASNTLIAGCKNTIIPNSVTSIGSSAFYDCTSLTSITIPSSVTSIGDLAFEGCTSLTSVTIPNSVTSIGIQAFNKCTNLTSVHISDIVAWCTIQFSNFNSNPLCYAHHLYINDTEITDLVIPSDVTNIRTYVFFGCSSLTSVTIPNSVTTIGGGAFEYCSSLTSVTIPDSVSNIGSGAFRGCSGLTSVTIPNSVTSIESSAFRDCSSLHSVILNSSAVVGEDYNNSNYSGFQAIFGPQVSEYIIGNDVTNIGSYAFHDCSGLKSITIGNNVTSIGSSAFNSCSNLTSVIWNAKNCNGYNFGKQVESFIFGDEVKIIPDHLCSGMTKLTSINIPNSVTSIGSYAFRDCSGLTSVTIPDSVSNIGSGAFRGCSGLTSIEIPNSVTSIEQETFYDCTGLTSISIPNSITSIGYGAFDGCRGLISVTIPNSVTSISNAFYGCSGLTSITVDEGNATYDSRNNCNAIIQTASNSLVVGCKNTIIPNSITSIEGLAFDGCSSLTSVTIPNSVTSIGYGAFTDCKGLKSVTCEAITPPYCYTSAWKNVDKYIPLYVPAQSINAYTTAGGWREFIHILAITTYTVTFINWDGSILLKLTDLEEGTTPIYTGATPTRPDDEQYTYTFDGWNPEIVPVAGDAIYTATYTASQKSEGIEDVEASVTPNKILHEGHIFIKCGDKVYTTTGMQL